MWLMTPFGFFSIVCAKNTDGTHATLRMIRARCIGHLIALRKRNPQLPPIKATQNTDYPYRIICDAGMVYQVVTAVTDDLNYTNFKSEAQAVSHDEEYVHFLHTVWAAGLHLSPPKAKTMEPEEHFDWDRCYAEQKAAEVGFRCPETGTLCKNEACVGAHCAGAHKPLYRRAREYNLPEAQPISKARPVSDGRQKKRKSVRRLK